MYMGDFLLQPASNSRKKAKRIGRGPGSGQGCTAGKGSNGQLARSGAKHRPWFEGGQMPLQRRLPKRGFKNLFRDEYEVINVEQLEVLSNGSVVTRELLYEAGLVKSKTGLVKILGNGALTKKLNITADGASKSAQEKIAAVGGSFTKIEKKKYVRPRAVRAKKPS
jgi:large subunit ribosomal protein L15